MAYKLLLLAALSVALVKAETDCNCDNYSEGEEKDLWKFLKELSADEPSLEDRDMASVIPGVLSPLLECNCLEKSRRKRKVVEEVTEKVEEVNHAKRLERHIHPARYHKDKRCPSGYVRIGVMCLSEDYLDN